MKSIASKKLAESKSPIMDNLVKKNTNFKNYDDYLKNFLEIRWFTSFATIKDTETTQENMILTCKKGSEKYLIVNWEISLPFHNDKHIWESISSGKNVLTSMYNKAAKERNEYNASYYFNEKKLPYSNEWYTIIHKNWNFEKIDVFPDAIFDIVIDEMHLYINSKWTTVLYDKQKPDSFKIATIDNIWWDDHNTNWLQCDIIDDNHIFIDWKKYLTKLFFKSR